MWKEAFVRLKRWCEEGVKVTSPGRRCEDEHVILIVLNIVLGQEGQVHIVRVYAIDFVADRIFAQKIACWSACNAKRVSADTVYAFP